MFINNKSYLEHELERLVEEYFDSPLFAQRDSLRKINQIRASLGMNPVDSMLHEIDSLSGNPLPKKKIAPVKDHTKARAIYVEYQRIISELAPHRAYCVEVERATGRGSMTYVEPLATMGTNGGPLLCDYCRKPMILEGGRFNRVPVDVAWARQPSILRVNWSSYISGGMVVENVSNGTLRVYHGHTYGNLDECCTKAKVELEAQEEKHTNRAIWNNCKIVTEFVVDEFPNLTESDSLRLVNDILNTVFGFNPGIGINRPQEEQST